MCVKKQEEYYEQIIAGDSAFILLIKENLKMDCEENDC